MSEQQPDEDANETSTADDTASAPAPEEGQGAISDEQLPEDLQPTEDNPLARHPGQTGDEDDKIGADSESGDADNPSASAGYRDDDGGSDSSSEGSSDAPVDAEEDDGSSTLENGGGGAG